ncbi:tRNA dihydrouridine synthase [Coemansia aciculifera]|nr:tRNA dihydrouridine synthase [Coemansia aciculifera]
MSAETNLYNPALFSGKVLPTWQMAEEYMEICNDVPTKTPFIRGHLFKLFRYSLPLHVDMRERLVEAKDMDGYWQFVRDMKARLLADAGDAEFDPATVVTDEFGYRKYPHWICQPALRFEHDKEHSKSKRLLSEAQADSTSVAADTCDNGSCDKMDDEVKRQKVCVENA